MSPTVPEPDDRAETTAPDPALGRTAGADAVVPPARCGTMFLAMQAMRDDSAAHTPER
jgi:hypothetical protein